MPTIDKLVVYLDHNVFSNVASDLGLKKNLLSLVKTNKYIFPFTHIHIGEVARIDGRNKASETNKLLSAIKEVSQSNYLDFRENINSFTIRPRDPFEVFETISEVPKTFIDAVSSIATDKYLRNQLPDLPKNCFRFEDQYRYFALLFRQQFPLIGKHINNLSKQEAIDYLEANVFKMPFSKAFNLLENSLNKAELNPTGLTLEFFIDNTLYLSGFKTPNRDLSRPSGLLSDHQHLSFSAHCSIVISNDKNFRHKVIESCDLNSKYVADQNRGINFLMVHSGLINIIAKETGEPLNKKYIDSCIEDMKNQRAKK